MQAPCREDPDTFGGRLCIALHRKGLSQRALAEALGGEERAASGSAVNAWFVHGKLPEGKYMLKLPGLLGVSGHWLLTGEGPMEPKPGEIDSYAEGLREAVEEVDQVLGRLRRRARPAAEGGPGARLARRDTTTKSEN